MRRNAGKQTAKNELMTGHALSDLWSSAIIFAPHLAGCMCAGGFHVPLDPLAVEEDLIDFLGHRYASEGLKTLAAFVGARSGNRQTSFNVWLRELDGATLSESERERLIDDLRTTLDSMNAQGSGTNAGMGTNSRGEIICY